jgi:hypothetical protein
VNFLQRRRARFLITRAQGFADETFIRAMGVSEEGISTLWRR